MTQYVAQAWHTCPIPAASFAILFSGVPFQSCNLSGKSSDMSKVKPRRVYDTRVTRDVYYPLTPGAGWQVWRVSRVHWGQRFRFDVPSFDPLFLGLVLKGRVRTESEWAGAGSVLLCGCGSGRHHEADPDTGAEMLICVCTGERIKEPFGERGMALPSVIRPGHPERLENLWLHLLDLGEGNLTEAGRIAGLLGEALCREILSDTGEAMSAADRLFLRTRQRLLDTLEARPTTESLSRELGVSRVYLNRIFRERAGETVFQFQQRHQMMRATEWLQEGIRVKEVAERLNWPDASSFSKAFSRVQGKPPGRMF
jgi:AraC-like DNA-binding protein